MDSSSLCDKDINTKEINKFHLKYAAKYKNKDSNFRKASTSIFAGQISAKGRGNMTSYAKNVKGSNSQKFQHFISESPWDEDPVIDKSRQM